MQLVTTTCKSTRVPSRAVSSRAVLVHAYARTCMRAPGYKRHTRHCARANDLFLSRASCNHLMPYLGPRTATRPFSVSLFPFLYPSTLYIHQSPFAPLLRRFPSFLAELSFLPHTDCFPLLFTLSFFPSVAAPRARISRT